eukprot:4327493-Pyramimonas_sp.AAC.2
MYKQGLNVRLEPLRDADPHGPSLRAHHPPPHHRPGVGTNRVSRGGIFLGRGPITPDEGALHSWGGGAHRVGGDQSRQASGFVPGVELLVLLGGGGGVGVAALVQRAREWGRPRGGGERLQRRDFGEAPGCAGDARRARGRAGAYPGEMHVVRRVSRVVLLSAEIGVAQRIYRTLV